MATSRDLQAIELLGFMPRILIIDDDPGTLETFQIILKLAGFDVATAATGSCALELARTRSHDLILADLRLPDMSGLDLLRVASRAGRDPLLS